MTLEWRAPVRNNDGSEDVQLEAAEVLRRVMEIPPPPPPPPPPTPDVDATPETVEGAAPSEPAKTFTESEEGEQPQQQQEEPVSPVQTETAKPSQEQRTGQAGEQASEEPTATETADETLPSEEALSEQSEVQAPPPLRPFDQEATVIATVESVEPGEALTFRDPWDPEWEGMRVQYAVRYVNRKGRKSRLSSVKNIDPLQPIDPPRGVTTEVEEGLVHLRWSPAEPSEEDDFSTHFNIYRRSDADLFPRDPLNGEPIEAALFEDRTVSFGQEYCYVIRSVAIPHEPEVESVSDPVEDPTVETEEELTTDEADATEPVSDEAATEGTTEPSPSETEEAVSEQARGPASDPIGPEAGVSQPPPPPVVKPLIESVDSEEVCLTPRDTYAPRAPANLFAVEVSDGILLSWDDVQAPDLRGYLVYRSEDDDGPFDLVTEQPVPLASHTDRTTQPGVVYYYTVSAVDRADPWNESPRSRVASARSEERP